MTAIAESTMTTDRTVSRDLLHRWSLSEVFLTGYHPLDETRFAAAAQLPLSHGYFRDRVAAEDVYDPLQVLEAGRQAMTYGAHVHQGLARDTAFLVRSWRLELGGRAVLRCGERPGELRIEAAVRRHARGGQVRRLEFAMSLELDGRDAGELVMDIGCAPVEQYLALRGMQRGRDLATAFAVSAEPAGPPVPPSDVDRRHPGNVVLDGLRADGDALKAWLSPRTYRNRSMYDHPYDHVPAMVLSEAASQLGLLLAGGASARVATRVDGRFARFAEVDEPVGLTSVPLAPGVSRMTAEQGGVVVAEIDVTLAEA